MASAELGEEKLLALNTRKPIFLNPTDISESRKIKPNYQWLIESWWLGKCWPTPAIRLTSRPRQWGAHQTKLFWRPKLKCIFYWFYAAKNPIESY